MNSRTTAALTLEKFTPPSARTSTVSASAAATTITGQAHGDDTSAFVEVSPLSQQSGCSWRGEGHLNATSLDNARGPRRICAGWTNQTDDLTSALLMSQVPPRSPFSSSACINGVNKSNGRGAGVTQSQKIPQATQEALENSETLHDPLLVKGPDLPRSRRTSHSSPDTIVVAAGQGGGGENGEGRVEDETYLPPRYYHFERLIYTGVFISFLLRSYYVGTRFFHEQMPQLRRGVGEPNKVLAALLPTIGYDGGLDRQWISFNHSLPSLFLVAAALGTSTRLLQCTARTHPLGGQPPTPPRNSASNPFDTSVPCITPRLVLRERDVKKLQALLYITVGVIFIAIAHGPHFFIPLLLTLANYVVFTRLQRWCPYWVFMAVMWVAHIALLYSIEMYAGFEDFYILQYVAPTDEGLATRVLGRPARPLWSAHLRWYVAFRMTTLRLIAFNYDLWEATHGAARARERAADKHDTTCVECAQLREQNSAASGSSGGASPQLPAEALRCYKYRTEYARDPCDYSLVNYLAYVVFPPLYLAGPMSSFNAFVSYMRVPSTAMPPRAMAAYALRTGALFLIAYVHLHFWFIIALSERIDLLTNASPEFQSYVLYYYLAYIWLKFNFIWKSSRLFAMFSGIEVPEDMRTCFSNTTTVRNFWRDWHASFNLWIVRYMYIPMGGRPRVALSVLPIFLFIALWHDPALHLLKWALCIAAMFVVELAVGACFGWVAGVFGREMASVRKQSIYANADHPNRRMHLGDATPRSALSFFVRPLARWSQQHLTPFQRGTIHREVVTLGCFFSVFGLIVANMVGFCVHNNAVELKDNSATDAVIWQALRSAHWRFYLGLFSILYSASGIGVSMWFWEDVMTRQRCAKYCLKTKPLPQAG